MRDKHHLKFEVLGSKFWVRGSGFEVPKTSNFPPSRPSRSFQFASNQELKTQNFPIRLACPAFLASLATPVRITSYASLHSTDANDPRI